LTEGEDSGVAATMPTICTPPVLTIEPPHNVNTEGMPHIAFGKLDDETNFAVKMPVDTIGSIFPTRIDPGIEAYTTRA
jgi:hypothetical protein